MAARPRSLPVPALPVSIPAVIWQMLREYVAVAVRLFVRWWCLRRPRGPWRWHPRMTPLRHALHDPRFFGFVVLFLGVLKFHVILFPAAPDRLIFTFRIIHGV